MKTEAQVQGTINLLEARLSQERDKTSSLSNMSEALDSIGYRRELAMVISYLNWVLQDGNSGPSS